MNHTTNRRRALTATLASAAVVAVLAPLAGQALAQEYPSRPITMVVPFPPGGVADTVGRPVADALGRYLGQSVVVENKAGAGGGIGMAHAAKQAPDGYTLLLALSSITIIPEADKVLKRSPMYQMNQLVPIARFTADPTVLAVRADSPWKTYADFIAHAKSKPGSITFGSSGNYGTMHVPMEMLKQATGTFMVHVPYTGAGPAIVGLLGEQVDALATGPATVVQHVKAGKLRVLAHWGEGRLKALPDVPSLTELGVPVKFSQWAGVFVPAGTPEPVIAKLRDASRKAAADEKVIRTIGTAGTPIQYLDAPEFAKFVADDAKVMAGVVQKIGKAQ
ncbi:tripartite tricarboxylate transporter substrate binding protein [Burkholderiaceae bacterium FT117]|uniref:Bug family tripartite tricarboxylate transporter substrate binding protein n=1 Tax=Zeimonas sediminis TaxID=2944268 RepID=UPI0023430954|nr:tripartite tricarboxylate transporter substrate binding protein [Zeimonas sediminis]MCM5570045.1 tripartite tricarboxylate transporter substrate binding protein [Zeimonas sediminis]